MLVTNQTPVYGESGGQQGDRGAAFSADGGEMEVHDTQKKLGDLHVHSGRMTHGSLKVGDAVELRVEGRRRAALRAHHSATPLLPEALRRRPGEPVTPNGSRVARGRRRFDHNT